MAIANSKSQLQVLLDFIWSLDEAKIRGMTINQESHLVPVYDPVIAKKECIGLTLTIVIEMAP